MGIDAGDVLGSLVRRRGRNDCESTTRPDDGPGRRRRRRPRRDCAYATTIRPFDAAALWAVVDAPEVVIVEPYLEGSSAAVINAALADRPHRLLAIGVPLTEPRQYGEPTEHRSAYGLDAAAIGRRVRAFLEQPASA